jgi:hypothetical protein
VAYYHIPKQFRNKFDVPGKRGIFVGYSRDRIAYRIYDITKNIVIEERAVKFDEKLKGSEFITKNSESYLWNVENLSQFNFSNLEAETEINPCEGNQSEINDTKSLQNETGNDQEIEKSNHELSPKLRRSERIKNKTTANLALRSKSEENNSIPGNYEQAINSTKHNQWKIAMQKELESMNKHNVFEIIKRPKNVKIIKSKWIYSVKTINDEEIYKARLVAAGFNLIKNKDYSESFSPVVNIESFRLLISLAAKLNLSVRFFDVKTAYLYGDIEETVYMEIPPGYEEQFGKNNVCKLKRSLYGLPQSGRNWHIKLKNELKRIGLNPLASDNCVFIISNETDFFAICIYVDDLAIFSNNSKLCEEIILKLRETFELNETTENSKFLGIEVLQNENGISLSQTHYIESLISKYGLENCKKANTPITKGEDRCFNPTDDLVNQTEYQEIIGEILYLANRTRPDLAFVASYLSQFNKRPEKRHYTLAKRVLKYLNATKNNVLFYDRENGFLNCCADASWGNGEGGKSFSGCVIMIGNSLLTWKSRKQKCVGLSTCEAELLAIADVARELTWTLNMLTELKCENFVKRPVVLYSDSQSAIDWLNSGKSSNKTRHVNLKFHFVKDLIESNTIKTKYINTNEMISDFLTKAVTFDKLLFSMKKICLM